MIDDSYPFDNPEKPSKSERKREMQQLQKWGEALLKLPSKQLLALELPNELLNAFAEAKKIPNAKALSRHHQYIGKLMRGIDEETLARIKRHLQISG